MIAVKNPARFSRYKTARQVQSDDEIQHDRMLIRRFVGGDQEAFAEIVHRYRSRIKSVAMRCIHNEQDAEEIAQDTFVRAHRGLSNFRGDSSLSTWLHRIAINLAHNKYSYWRRRMKHSWVSLDAPVDENSDMSPFSETVSSEQDDHIRSISLEEFRAVFVDAMDAVPESFREVLVLFVFQNCTYVEMAEILGTEVGTVKSRVFRARNALSERMQQVCPDLPPRNEMRSFLMGRR